MHLSCAQVQTGARIGCVKQPKPIHRARKALLVSAKKTDAQSGKGNQQVQYGQDWYEQTREASRQLRTAREELEYRREANRIANGGKERKDLYTNNWDGDQYKGSKFNILTVIALVSILTPLLGLVFAYSTYGILWG
eukprot:GHRR01005903.1.p1 GENE.GHRR01005903.1~~GHRR01005903.1.p1  ORF type:complete len:137 (+),score=13.65 GHRR01005903.1:179-589(+)